MLKVIGGLRRALSSLNQSRSIYDLAVNGNLTKPIFFFSNPTTHKHLPSQHHRPPLIDPIHQQIEKFDPLPFTPFTLPTSQIKKIEDGVGEKPSMNLMPLLITIRRKKMKKHKRRKLRRKLLFVNRKFRHAQQKIKEKKIVDYEIKQKKWGEAYDASADMACNLDKARRAGWGIDVIAEYTASKR